jgi:hypothetical protein
MHNQSKSAIENQIFTLVHVMPVPLNTVFLTALLDIDFLATLALADASSYLHYLIFDQVVTVTHLCRFLREQQYVLFHDDYVRLFSDREVVRIVRAVEKVRLRHGSVLYEQVVGLIGPLISRISWAQFENPMSLPSDFRIRHIPDSEGFFRGFYSLDDIRVDYDDTFRTSWVHVPEYVRDGGRRPEIFYRFHEETSNRYLREDFLFCKRYVSDFNTCHHIVRTMPKIELGDEISLMNGITKIQETLAEKELSPILKRRCLQASLQINLHARPIEDQVISATSFLAIFEQPGWMEMWDASELGWWLAIGLSQYGPDPIEKLIDQNFINKHEALMWLFLGAHH